MATLFFPEHDTLRLVLASGGMSATVMGEVAEAGWDDQRRLWLTTSTDLTREITTMLQRLGVRVVESSMTKTTEKVACWQQLLPLEKSGITANELGVSIVFELPGDQFGSLIGEIERCRGGSYSFRWLDDVTIDSGSDRILVLAESPPHFTLLRAVDNADVDSGVRAFYQQAPRVWVAVGWRHSFARQIDAPAGKLLFLSPPRIWRCLDDLPFQASSPALEPSAAIKAKPFAEALAAFPVPLHLRPFEDSAAAEMWIVRKNALAWLERFLQRTDQQNLHRFTCAVIHNGDNPSLILRLRGKGPAPILLDPPLAFRPLLKLANLFVPCGFAPVPMPRRDTIRQLLSADPSRLTWLRNLDSGLFAAESAPMAAFRPLADLVDYRPHAPTRTLTLWLQSANMAFEPFVERPVESVIQRSRPNPLSNPVKELPTSTKVENKSTSGWLSRVGKWLRGKSDSEQPIATSADDDVLPLPIDEAVRTALPTSQSRSLGQSSKMDEAKQRARVLTTRFHESLEELTPAKRLEMWPELAAAFTQANLPSEAAICWLNGLWEQPRPSPLWAWGWFKSEAAQAGWNPHQVDLNRWLTAPADEYRPRAIAAYALWATLQPSPPDSFSGQLAQINTYLHAHERRLPIRAAWLVQMALARATRGDVLALAHTRDRLLARLHENGLSLARDVPSFVRNADDDDPDRSSRVGKWLTTKRKTINEWVGSLGPEAKNETASRLPLLYELEAEIPCTQAYADLLIAWGLNRLGETNESGRLLDIARRTLPASDAIHGILGDVFDWRLQEAREQHSAASLPTSLLTRIESLNTNDRYQVDLLRQHLRILDPLEQIDARWASTMRHFQGWGELRRQLIELPALEHWELNRRVKLLIERAAREESEERQSILLAILRLANHVDRGSIETALDLSLGSSAGSQVQFLRMLNHGLQAAAMLGLDGKVRLFAHRFASYVEEQKGQTSPNLLEGLTGQSFRCLRKLGMKEEADQVLSRIALWLTRGMDLKDLRRVRANDWPILLRTLLHVAAGWYYCGRSTQGHRIIDEVRNRDLFDGAMTLPDRTALALAYAGAIGQIPVKLAQGCYEELFMRLKKIAVTGWNTHYTLQPLQLVDTVVRAVVSEDFSLGPGVRGFLDDDEFCVRQRIHREMKEWTTQLGE